MDLYALLPSDLAVVSAGGLVALSFFTSALTAAVGIGGGVVLLAVMASFLPPLVVLPVREARDLAHSVVVHAVVGDVELFGEGRPGAEHEGVLMMVSMGLARLIDMKRRESFASASASV